MLLRCRNSFPNTLLIPLSLTVPDAMAININHTNKGVAILSAKWPKNHLIPSGLSILRIDILPALAAFNSHDNSINDSCNTAKMIQTTANMYSRLFFIWGQIVDIQYSQFKCPYDKTCGVDTNATVPVRKQFLNQFVLSLLQTLYAERHTTQVGYLFFGISQGKMSEKTFVIFVYLIVDQCLLTDQLVIDGIFEPFHDFLQYRLVEHETFAFHHTTHITTGQQLTAFKDNTVSSCVKYIDSQFLVQYFACKNKHFHFLTGFLCLSTYFDSYSCRTAQTWIEKHKIRIMF